MDNANRREHDFYRKARRHHVLLPGVVTTRGGTFVCTVEDISLIGTRVNLGRLVEAGVRGAKNVLELPGLDTIEFDVVWSKGDKMGISFRLRDDQKFQLLCFLDQLSE